MKFDQSSRLTALPQALARRQGGSTLIEILVSLGLFCVGALGYVSLQAIASTLTQGGGNMTRAALLANDLIANMQVAGTANVSKADWQALVSGSTPSPMSLPGGSGDYVIDGSGSVTITINWQEPQRTNTSGTPIPSSYRTVYKVN